MYSCKVADDTAEASTEAAIFVAVKTLIEDNLKAGTDAKRCMFPVVEMNGRFSVWLTVAARSIAVDTLRDWRPA